MTAFGARIFAWSRYSASEKRMVEIYGGEGVEERSTMFSNQIMGELL
jgi:hypothetical protein